MTVNGKAKFCLGQIVATPGAIDAMEESRQSPEFFLNRHVHGDWGEVCQEDGQLRMMLAIEPQQRFCFPKIIDRRKT